MTAKADSRQPSRFNFGASVILETRASYFKGILLMVSLLDIDLILKVITSDPINSHKHKLNSGPSIDSWYLAATNIRCASLVCHDIYFVQPNLYLLILFGATATMSNYTRSFLTTNLIARCMQSRVMDTPVTSPSQSTTQLPWKGR
jgi:hypothetical protein